MPVQRIGPAIAKRAKQISRTGVWMDWLDATLFSMNHRKSLGIVRHCDAGSWTIEDAHQQWSNIPGVSADGNTSWKPFERSKDAWILISCSTDFDRKSSANHWVPAVCRELVDVSLYSDLTNQQIAHSRVQIASIESDMRDLELEEDADVKAMMQESLETQRTMHLVWGLCVCFQFSNR